MMFILRAVFWLCLVSVLLPDREGEIPNLNVAAGELAGAAMDYCSANPQECVTGAGAAAETLRIPAEFVLRAQQQIAAGALGPAGPLN